ncbi:hypothetical protein PNV01_13420 [Turicibacter sanguinis]|uniref:hypothetical protein n=1 Tax=Turicibacter sanguinis TaxID=154288 RepID=UPI00232DA1AD|nr:hypothetical protein [Turicibacter sanguinis]MDB8545803.1 hypothetical protein [Turicibacter sanguinis]
MTNLSFESCETIIECVNRYHYFLNLIDEAEKPILDLIFTSHIENYFGEEIA